MRLFFAVQPTAEQSETLLSRIAPLFAAHQVSVIPVTNLHATLCFLGAVAKEKLPALCEAAARVRSRGVSLAFDTLEYWPKPKIICATAPEQGASAASALARALSDAVIEAGFSPDIKPFRAHLTLARKIRAAQATALSLPQFLQPGFVVRCAEFALMESRRGETGSIYSVVARWPLYEKQER
jgi:RNA 2',3'-cyclic 3'-phosphodiesterase